MDINQHGMTLHFHTMGLPISWGLVAIYGGNAGICWHAAKSWYEKSDQKQGQWVIRFDQHQSVLETQLFLSRVRYGLDAIAGPNQHYILQHCLLQFQSHPFRATIPETIKALCAQHLIKDLTEFGYIIPKDEWIARYPDRHAQDQQIQADIEAHVSPLS